MDYKLLLLLVAVHYLADFALQTEYMAQNKQVTFIKSIGFHTLTAHAFIHGLVAGVITQSYTIGVIVGTTHWIIDFFKASKLIDNKYPHTKGARKNGQTHGMYGINVDQFLHILVLVLCVAFVA